MAESWQERCRAQGGIPTIRDGVPACRFGSGKPGDPLRYESALTLTERIKYTLGNAAEQYRILDGKVVQARDDLLYGGKEPPGTLFGGIGAILGTQVNRVADGAAELGANALGIPKGTARVLVIVVAVGALAFVALPYVKLAARAARK